jgi:hypothetical protein
MDHDESKTLPNELDDNVLDLVSHALKLEVLHSPDIQRVGSVTVLPPSGALVVGREVEPGSGSTMCGCRGHISRLRGTGP